MLLCLVNSKMYKSKNHKASFKEVAMVFLSGPNGDGFRSANITRNEAPKI